MKRLQFNWLLNIQRWMDTITGQTVLNYAYSWGASIVILGTLFKLTHLPGANFMLYLGMGTEVIVFFLAAFDRPFDRTKTGRQINKEVTDNMTAHNNAFAVMPDCGQNELQFTIHEVNGAYNQCLEHVAKQMDSTAKASEELKQLADNIAKINDMYAAMIDSLKK